MKKLLSVLLAFAMVMCLSITAFAEGGFVSSPSENLAPELIEPTDGSIVIHSYAERQNLTERQRKALEDAYNSILNNSDLTKLNSELEGIAKNQKLNPSKLSVSDLFNVSSTDSTSSGAKTVKLKADTLNNFVALMTYVDGKWQIVNSAKIENGNLVFDAENFGPYAIVVNTESAKSPQTGIVENTDATNNSNNSTTSTVVYGALMVISAFAAFVMWRKSKKYTA